METKKEHKPIRPETSGTISKAHALALQAFEAKKQSLPEDLIKELKEKPTSYTACITVGIYVTAKITESIFSSLASTEGMSEEDKKIWDKFRGIVQNAVSAGYREGCCYERNYNEFIQGLEQQKK